MNTKKLLLLLQCCFVPLAGLLAQSNTIAIFPEEDPLTPETRSLVWPATPGVRYEVRQSTNLQTWTTAPGFPAAAPGPAQQMPFATDGTARFFRVRQLDEQPPTIASQYPQDGAYAVPRFGDLALQLADVTGIDPASILLSLSTRGTFTLSNTNLTYTNNVLAFKTGADTALGGWGSNVVASLVVADTLGNRVTNTWNFTLETEPQVTGNLFVFGSPKAQGVGQFVGNIPTAVLAARLPPVSSDNGPSWVLQSVQTNLLVIAYTNTAPVFATNTYVCNLTPASTQEIFNRKITDISDDPKNKLLTLFTVEVPLTEIVSNGTACISADSVILQAGTNGVFTKAFTIGGTVTFPRIGYSLDGAEFKLKDSVGDFDIVDLTLEEQHWWLTPRLQVALEVDWGGVKRFQAIASGNVDAASVWNVDFLLAGAAVETTLFDLPEALQPKTWMFLGFIGLVPVYASLGLDVDLKARAEVLANLNFRAGQRQTMDAAFGASYSDGSVQWVNTFNFPPPEVIPFTANINAQGSLTVSLEPTLDFLVYGLAGVSAGITPSGDIVFEAGTGQPLSGRLEADVSLDLSLTGPGFAWLNPKPELSLALWHDESHLFPNAAAISFDQQPQSQTAQVGGSAYFYCTVTGPQTPAYQWYFNAVPMPGQTARTLLLPCVSSGHAGNYKVRVTAGSQTADSAPATLTVTQPLSSPQIVSQPQGQSAPVGTTAAFSVQAQGGGTLTYRWSKDGAYLSDGGGIIGSTGSTLQIVNVQTSDAGNYRVRVSNQSSSADSSNANLTLLPAVGSVVLIPAGSFIMGNCMDSSEGDTRELPLHTVYVSGFYMDQYLVTSNLWLVVKAWNGGSGYSYDYAGSGKASNHPVQSVDWFDRVKWCNARSQKEGLVPCYYTDSGLTVVYKTGQVVPYVKWAANGYRLPTEAEWEKAARGGASGHRFPWSDADTINWGRANYKADPSWYSYDVNPTSGHNPAWTNGGLPLTTPVGSFAANGYGLYDMAGNVRECCWDWYDDTWYSNAGATQNDTRGPASSSSPYGERVLRGGSGLDDAYYSRCAHRYYYDPTLGIE